MYRTLIYQRNNNLGDGIQAYCMARLLPSPTQGVYRDELSTYPPSELPLVANAFLCDKAPKDYNTLFAGIFVGGNYHETFHWLWGSNFKVAARDPFTQQLLAEHSIESEMTGCCTLTLPRYEGPRSGIVAIDAYWNGVETASNCCGSIPWREQWDKSLALLDKLRTAELVVTSRLHVCLPCLAFGTPCYMPKEVRAFALWPERFSLLDHIGFRFGMENVIDVSSYAELYKDFLVSQLGPLPPENDNPKMPMPMKVS